MTTKVHDDMTRTAAAVTAAELRGRARVLRRELTPAAARADAENIDAGESMAQLWRDGFFAYHLPLERGGLTGGNPASGTRMFFDTLVDLVAGDSAAGMNFVVQSLTSIEIFGPANPLPASTKDRMAQLILEEGVRICASNSETGSPRKVTGRRVAGGIVVSGTKTFNTNSGGGGWANVGLAIDGEEGRWHALIPLDQDAVTCKHDWDVMGQRGTHSQAIQYDDVFVSDDYVWKSGGFEPELVPFVFLLHSAIMLGIGYGAFDAVLDYVRKLDRPSLPEFSSASEDPLLRKRIGSAAVDLESARAYLLSCASKIETFSDSYESAAEAAIEGFAVKVACVRAGLQVSQDMFDLTGARGTSSRYGFDRYWRNARTFSTHDSTDAKEVWVGGWHLTGLEPPFVAMLRV